jgi:hypothetical protein
LATAFGAGFIAGFAAGFAAGATFATATVGLETGATFVAGAGDFAAGLDVFFFMAIMVVSVRSG